MHGTGSIFRFFLPPAILFRTFFWSFLHSLSFVDWLCPTVFFWEANPSLPISSRIPSKTASARTARTGIGRLCDSARTSCSDNCAGSCNGGIPDHWLPSCPSSGNSPWFSSKLHRRWVSFKQSGENVYFESIPSNKMTRPLRFFLFGKKFFSVIFSQANLCKNLFEELTKYRDSLNAVAIYTTFRNITHHPAVFFAHLNKLADAANTSAASGQAESLGPICQLLVNLVQVTFDFLSTNSINQLINQSQKEIPICSINQSINHKKKFQSLQASNQAINGQCAFLNVEWQNSFFSFIV